MNKIVDKLWKNLWGSLCENCGENLNGWCKSMYNMNNCVKISSYTHNWCNYALSFTHKKYLCFNSMICTVSTRLIITIINNLLINEYNINRRCA